MKTETLVFRNKEYRFHSAPNGDGILIEIDGIKVLLPWFIIDRLYNKPQDT